MMEKSITSHRHRTLINRSSIVSNSICRILPFFVYQILRRVLYIKTVIFSTYSIVFDPENYTNWLLQKKTLYCDTVGSDSLTLEKKN